MTVDNEFSAGHDRPDRLSQGGRRELRGRIVEVSDGVGHQGTVQVEGGEKYPFKTKGELIVDPGDAVMASVPAENAIVRGTAKAIILSRQ